MKKDFSLKNVKSVIAMLDELNLDDEFAYEKAIRLYARVGLPTRPVGKFASETTTVVFRCRVEKERVEVKSATDVGVPPEKIRLGRCNPGAKPKFYGGSNYETCQLETIPSFIRDNGLKEGDDFYTYLSRWFIVKPFGLVSLVSPYESSWTTDFERQQGAAYRAVIMGDDSKTDEEKEGAMMLMDYVASSLKQSEDNDPSVYVKTAAFLGYLFSIDYGVKGVFYQSVKNLGKGYNMAIHSSFYQSGAFLLIDVIEEHRVVTNAASLGSDLIGDFIRSRVVEEDGIVRWD